ncbi:MAG: histidinol-phosphate transaminase [Pelagibacteraceae bacterium TMED216]|nr:MAG: histidinol-phosphate transaminase [Pelagibacteraceae bacterium TMED216]|tara:strand:+ start:1681 stop:2757 length:1077 start_codon:yes stop_codon:yes gene_type:complete
MNLPKPKKINAEKYIAGLSLFKQKVAKIKLSANESALGPSPKAIKEFNRVAKNIKRYPDSDGVFLRSVLAKKFRLDPKRIILGSGSDQIFELICKAFLDKNDEVVVPEYSFIIYRIYSKICGAKIRYAKEKNYKISVENILAKVTRKTKIVFLANPNNPTGTIISKNELLRLRKKLRSNILLVIDDAYFEYVKDKNYLSGIKLFSNFKNVIITRTFSKIYGLAGLRIGWAYGPKKLIYALNQVKPPFNINRAALFAAVASIKDVKWLSKEIKHVNKWANIFYKNFKDLGIETNVSYGNFLLVSFDRIKKNSKKIFLKLAKKGVLVRKMDVYKIKNSLRITIGNNMENKKFLKIIKKVI